MLDHILSIARALSVLVNAIFSERSSKRIRRLETPVGLCICEYFGVLYIAYCSVSQPF